MKRTIVHQHMRDLFGRAPELPDGFSYVPDFITPDEERVLITNIQQVELGHLTIQGVPSKRRIKSFGLNYSFLTKQLTPGLPIPDFLLPLREKVGALLNKTPQDFTEVLITEYRPGAGITWHCDAPPFDCIAGISLLGNCIMKLRPIENHQKVISLNLEPRSAYILNGDVRENWEHHIPLTKILRYSITFRNVRD